MREKTHIEAVDQDVGEKSTSQQVIVRFMSTVFKKG
jgi:hypothetical protein